MRSSNTNRVREIMEKVDNDSESLNEDLAACHYLLNYMHAELARKEVFNVSLSDLDNKKSNEELDEVLANLKSAAKVNLALGFILPNVETNDY